MNRRNASVCPYCQETSELRRADEVYGPKARAGYWYVCPGYPDCDSYVGVQKGTTIPLGSMANACFRAKRRAAHEAFDRLWKEGGMSRNEAYRWLGKALLLTSGQAHIARFTESQCDLFIRVCRMVSPRIA